MSEAEVARSPTRIMRAEPVVYHWRRRLGNTMTESGFSATPVSGGECTSYLRADVAADEKRRRDVLLADLVQALETVRTALESEGGLDDGDAYRGVCASLHRAARFKAEHGSLGDARPRAKGPTPEAGYQSLLRETAGERLGATK